MSNLRFDIVILDGANIIHDNLPNGELTLEPKRLLSAIEHCENKGWETLAALKHGTYMWAKHHHSELEEGDFELLEEMIDQGKIELISQNDEDIFWIDTALEDKGYIITEDTFEDRVYPNGRKVQRERSLYPDRNWDEIDQRTLRYSFIRGKFRCPGLPDKPDFVPEDKLEILQNDNLRLKQENEELRAKIRALNSKLKASTTAQTYYDQEIVDVFENLLGHGEEVSTNLILTELAKAILQLGEDVSDWPQGWAKNLREKLGFPRSKKFTSFLEDLSQIVTKETNHRIAFDSERQKVKYAL